MTLSIGAALRDGFFKVASRTGSILIAAYLVVNVVFEMSLNGVMQNVYAQEGIDETAASFEPALNAPLPVTGALVVLCVLLMVYLSIVAIRTFVTGDRDSIRRDHLTKGIAFAMVNLIVGGIIQSVLVFIGSIFFLIPGLFLAVALLFMAVFIAVENENFVTAMRRSWNLTEGSRWTLFLLGVVITVLGFVFGMIVGISSFIGITAGVNPAITSVITTAMFLPVSLYSTGVLASAFNQLRDDELDEPDTGTATSDPSSSLA